MMYSATCRDCKEQFFSFDEKNIGEMSVSHMYNTGHLVLQDKVNTEQTAKDEMEQRKEFFFRTYLGD